jgi:hypothetical protein
MNTTLAFKEWSLVCHAIGTGLTSLILRKGGIHEGRRGFHFDHDAFWLFPTSFHAQRDQLRLPPGFATRTGGEDGDDPAAAPIEINVFCRLVKTWEAADPAAINRLAPYHLWAPEVVEERFQWGDTPMLKVALVRAYKLATPLAFPYEKGRFGGCRSWVDLPELPSPLPTLAAALDDDAHEALHAQIAALL